MIYDIIGDIHGQADKLVGLLRQLGYQLTTTDDSTFYTPPDNHKAIFVGDLIDRGKQEIKTLNIVFAMLDAGVAEVLMGNHEYNALAFATLNKTSNDGSYLRPHRPDKVEQHQAFLDEVPFGSPEHEYWLSRFYELPLWIETAEACFVHACWDTESMAVLRPWLTDDNRLTAEGLQATGQRDSAEYLALERVLKGVETHLPNGLFITDRYGTKRHNIRVKWWLDKLQQRPIHQIAQVPSSDKPQLASLPNDITAEHILFCLQTEKPVFIGHYWMKGIPEPLSQQVVCTDYSAAIDSGYLTCYQFDSDNPQLTADNFIQFNHHQNG